MARSFAVERRVTALSTALHVVPREGIRTFQRKSGHMNTKLDEAMEPLDALGGWRAFFLIDAAPEEAQAFVDALPWVENGQARAGTVVRIFSREQGLIIVTGGAIGDEEAAVLFDIHEAVRDIAKRVIVVPPASATPGLIARAHKEGLAPVHVETPLPNAKGWKGAAVFALFATGYGLRVARRMGGGTLADASVPVFLFAVLGLALTGLFALMAWRTGNELTSALADPIRVVCTRWAMAMPSRPRG